MAISFVGASAAQEGTGTSSTAVPLPAGVAAGDFLVLVGSVNNSAKLITTPAGWVEQVNSFGFTAVGVNAAVSMMVATRVATGSEGSTVTVDHPPNNHTFQTLAFRGVDGATPLDVAAAYDAPYPASNTFALPVLTVATTGAALVYAATLTGSATTATPPAGFTETLDQGTGARPGTAGYKLGAATGTTGPDTILFSGSGRGVNALLALRPASGAPPAATVWKRWNGTAWQDVTLRRWDGTTWVT